MHKKFCAYCGSHKIAASSEFNNSWEGKQLNEKSQALQKAFHELNGLIHTIARQQRKRSVDTAVDALAHFLDSSRMDMYNAILRLENALEESKDSRD